MVDPAQLPVEYGGTGELGFKSIDELFEGAKAMGVFETPEYRAILAQDLRRTKLNLGEEEGVAAAALLEAAVRKDNDERSGGAGGGGGGGGGGGADGADAGGGGTAVNPKGAGCVRAGGRAVWCSVLTDAVGG